MKLSKSLKSDLCRSGKDLIVDVACVLDILCENENFDDEYPLLKSVFSHLDSAYAQLDEYMCLINHNLVK